MIDVICAYCNKSFQKPTFAYNFCVKSGRQMFCSHTCHNESRKGANKITCPICTKLFKPQKKSKFSKSGLRFCSHKCANAFIGQTKKEKSKGRLCKFCKTLLDRDIYRKDARVCKECQKSNKTQAKLKILDKWNNITKEEIFKTRKNWQSARTEIRDFAGRVYNNSCMPKKCLACGYELHYQVCHIKAVKDFEGSATLGEINSISNLIALCPTHHWEQENGIIDPHKLLARESNPLLEELYENSFQTTE